MPNNATQIAELNDVIRAGATFVTVDSQQIQTDLGVLQQERRDLLALDDTHKGDRPRVCRFDLSQGP